MGLRDEVKTAWDDVMSPLFDEFAADVAIEVLDTENTVRDDLYDESVQTKKYKDPVIIKGRAKIGKDRLVLSSGESKDIDGRITFKTEDLKVNGIQMDFGTRINFKDKNYIVIHIEERSGIGEEFLLTRVFLQGA